MKTKDIVKCDVSITRYSHGGITYRLCYKPFIFSLYRIYSPSKSKFMYSIQVFKRGELTHNKDITV